jgi:hypothetical protein
MGPEVEVGRDEVVGHGLELGVSSDEVVGGRRPVVGDGVGAGEFGGGVSGQDRARRSAIGSDAAVGVVDMANTPSPLRTPSRIDNLVEPADPTYRRRPSLRSTP